MMTSTERTTKCIIGSEIIAEREDPSIRIHFVIAESISAFLSVFGNAFVIYVFCNTRRVRSTRNYYIASLAGADFLMEILGTPFSISTSLGYPRDFLACRFAVSSIMFLGAVSIYGIVAVAFDRYLATSDPFAYYRLIHTPTAIGICVVCWAFGGLIGFLPLFGWYNPYGENCFTEYGYCLFTDVIHDTYLQFFYVFNVMFLTILLIGFYGGIYRIIVTKMKKEDNVRIDERPTTGPATARRSSSTNSDVQPGNSCGGIIEHVSLEIGRYRWKEVKAAKKVGFIIFFFMLCWMPSTILNLIYTFDPSFHVSLDVLDWAVILSHANSALNPFLYAYHLKEFRIAMKNTLRTAFCCRSERIESRGQQEHRPPRSRTNTEETQTSSPGPGLACISRIMA